MNQLIEFYKMILFLKIFYFTCNLKNIKFYNISLKKIFFNLKIFEIWFKMIKFDERMVIGLDYSFD
jgi:hypothetical protein